MMQIENHKTTYQLSIKNISKLLILVLIIFSACNKVANNEISFKVDNVTCKVNYTSLEKYLVNDNDFQENDKIFISTNEDQYRKIISQISSTTKIDHDDLIDEKYGEYNSIFLTNAKPTSGFILKFNRAILINQSVLNLYFEEFSPESNSIVNTVVTQPYCLMRIDNIEKYEVKVMVE